MKKIMVHYEPSSKLLNLHIHAEAFILLYRMHTLHQNDYYFCFPLLVESFENFMLLYLLY